MSSTSPHAPESTKPAPSAGFLGSTGAYQLVEELPQRGDVFVYLARQRGPGGFERFCTLKTAKRSSDARAAESLSREAKVMARLDHPNIVRLHDFFEHDASLVFVLERFSGLTLERFVELSTKGGARLDDRIIWHVALGLFDALAHAHGLADQEGQPAPILHRDVRPANVLVASDGRVRLTGFAFARDVDLDESTACAAVYRAPSYVAPEVMRATPATERGDAFSAALVIWELLTGKEGTRRGLTDFELLKHLASRTFESLRTARPDIPALVSTALDACLMTDPAERRIGCAEVAGCIRAGLEPGDGATVLRDAVATLGPAVERLAGGKAAVPRTAQVLSIQVPEAPHRQEMQTIPDAAPDPVLPQAPAVRTPLQGAVFSNEPDATPDDDILAMEASEKRRRKIRFAMLGVPVVVLIGALAAAFSGPVCTQTGDVGSQPLVSVPAQSSAAIPESPAEAPSKAVPATSVVEAKPAASSPVPAGQAMLIVQGPPEGEVYVMGKSVGRTDQPILTDCGQRYVRVGTPARQGALSTVRWLGAGKSVRLRCGERAVVPAGE